MNQKLIEMKKIGKLNINSDKIMKSEELVNLKGGYSAYNCTVYTDYGDFPGIGFAESCAEALAHLYYIYYDADLVCCDTCGCQ